MKIRLLLLCFSVFGSASLAPLARGQAADAAAPAAPKSPMDADHDAVWAIWREQNPDPDLRKNNPREWFKVHDDRMRRFSEAGRAYTVKYPADPRRYTLLIQASYTRPRFITGFKPEFDAAPNDNNLIIDQPALIAFWEKQLQFMAEVIESPATEFRQKGGAMNAYLIDSRSLARLKGEKYDVQSAGPMVERAMTKYADESILAVVDLYLSALKQESPEAAKAFEAKARALPRLAAAMAEQETKREAAVAEKAKKLTALNDLKFTAADGREVEIAKLKGKVVLIDFWATWCGPCIREIPNVVANYNKYHAQGFEVIGITLEDAKLLPKDTPEQTATKLEAAKKKMTDFTAKNSMPWPQFFDGKFWKGNYVAQFGIEGIPAMFLLDQEGRIVSTEARGEKLEAEIKRLLKL